MTASPLGYLMRTHTHPGLLAHEDPCLGTQAVLSADGVYRYYLYRPIEVNARYENGSFNARRCCFVMLNPSTADGFTDDQTIRRCKGYAAREDCAHLDVVNLFAYRATKPDDLIIAAREGIDVSGPYNGVALKLVEQADVLVYAWGSTLRRLAKAGVAPNPHDLGRLGGLRRARCLGKLKDGSPRHPFRGAYVPLVPFFTTCEQCNGAGCEENCGRCEMAYAGPDSHRVCTRCGGTGAER